MAREGLFDDLPEQAGPTERDAPGRPRLREPMREQIELRAVDVDSLIGADHPARIFWAYVEELDLHELEDAIRSRENHPGHPAIAPRLMLALWLYATSEGVGSARALDELCGSHDAYRWLCGGVSVNYHTLSDFRVGHGALLDRLLTQNVAALMAAGLIDLKKLAQDGVRVRAAAGAKSFRRRKTIEAHLAQAGELVEQLKREVEDAPGASRNRLRAARERVARERQARLATALAKHDEVAAQRERREKTNRKETEKQKEPRVSTTDPDARVIKMADGGFRPAWNTQIASAAGTQIIVGVDIAATGSDRGLIKPMIEQIQERYGVTPESHLADGGFNKGEDIEWAASSGIKVYCPPVKSKHGTDPFAPRDDDGPGTADWRRRMASPEGQAQYAVRCITECIHARARECGLNRFTVRGRAKAKCVLLLHALTNNILQGFRLAKLALQACPQAA
jgi:transposase